MSDQRELILSLKDAKKEQRISSQAIVDRLEARREYLSLATVKRVFAPGSEDSTFRDDTLDILSRLLLGEGTPLEERIPGDEAQAERFRAFLEYARNLNNQKDKHIDLLTADNTFLRCGYRNAIRGIVILAIALFIVTGFLVGLLIYDLAHTDRGWIQALASTFASFPFGDLL